MIFVLLDKSDLKVMRKDSNLYCGLMGLVSIFAFVTGISIRVSFGAIGGNVAKNLRRRLYESIISKHMGWFDDRENAPGILSSTLSSDAQIINGASTEGL